MSTENNEQEPEIVTGEVTLEEVNDIEVGDLESDKNIKETETFVYMENVKSILDVSMKTGNNVILYGPGGYGKSEYSLAYLRENDIDPYVITMGCGMTTDRLFGGLDIPKFNSTGKIEYLVENSFMNYEYVIFEELFDAPDFILEQLKDILSSGVFRNGEQKFVIKTRLVICCTNRTREEFSKNNSLKALMERFPLEAHVVWKDHNRLTYENLFNKKLGFADPMLSYILERYAASGIVISPRIAIKAAEVISVCGPDAISHLADFGKKPELLKESVQKFASIVETRKIAKEAEVAKISLFKNKMTTEGEIEKADTDIKKISAIVVKLKTMKADDTIVSTISDMVKEYDGIIASTKKKIDLAKQLIKQASLLSDEGLVVSEYTSIETPLPASDENGELPI